ncbi:spinster family MFS transporter [Phenylobacterium immobile]|uniref:spinster family MFS transporter n=1 Tax=Phenylobacterium immobile TaxID=21 RepID=UPI000A43E248|nr:MFS transporter [Phenylobacterium immobile]
MNAKDQAASDVAARPPSRPYALYVLGLLAIGNIFNTLDRLAFTLLLEPIKEDLHATDTQMSLLSGFAFVIFYTVFGIPIARWADKWVRKTILSIGLVGWSIMTMLCGAAGNFWQMALVRAGVGIGESAGIPPSLSLITDYFRRRERAQAIAVFQTTAVLAMVIGSPMVGLVASLYGWRVAFFAAGAPGVILGLIVFFTVREPLRGRMDHLDPAPTAAPGAAAGHGHGVELGAEGFWASLRVMFASKPFLVLFIAQVILGLANGITATWTPAFMMRVHGIDIPWVTNILAPTWGASGILGGLAGGFMSAHLVRKSGKGEWMILLPALAMMIGVGLQLGFIFGGTVWISLACGCSASFFMSFKNAPIIAEALEAVPTSTRSLAGAMMLIGANVLGQGFGPLFTGMISDYLLPILGKADAIRWAFMLAPGLGAIGGLFLLVNTRVFRKTVADS